MSDIPRFSPIDLMRMSCRDPSEHRPFVYASDYDALLAELKIQDRANDILTRDGYAYVAKIDKLKAQIETLERIADAASEASVAWDSDDDMALLDAHETLREALRPWRQSRVDAAKPHA